MDEFFIDITKLHFGFVLRIHQQHHFENMSAGTYEREYPIEVPEVCCKVRHLSITYYNYNIRDRYDTLKRTNKSLGLVFMFGRLKMGRIKNM